LCSGPDMAKAKASQKEWGQLLISAYKQELAHGQGLPAESV
jgi:hypothetical protein